MLGDAFDFVRDSDDWVPTTFIGGLLSALSFLILPGLIVQGYLIRVLRDSVDGESEAPSFTRWGELLVDGLKVLLIGFAYSLIVVVPVVLISLVVLGGASLGGDSGGVRLFASLASVLLFLVAFALSLVVAYLLPAAMANFAVEGRLSAAFDFGTIRRVIFTGDYAIAWLVGLIVNVAGGLIGGALTILAVGIFIVFLAQVLTFYVWGRGFAEALNRDRVEYAAV